MKTTTLSTRATESKVTDRPYGFSKQNIYKGSGVSYRSGGGHRPRWIHIALALITPLTVHANDRWDLAEVGWHTDGSRFGMVQTVASSWFSHTDAVPTITGRIVNDTEHKRMVELFQRVAQGPIDKPAPKSKEAVYQEQHVLFDRRFTLELGFSYSRFDRKQINLSGFLALDAIFLGTISVDDVEADIVTFDTLARWGISKRMQVDLTVPFMYRRTVFGSGGVGGDPGVQSETTVTLDPDFRLGDVSAGLYYQLRPETATNPDIVWNIRIKAPTGSDPFGVKVIRDPSNDNLSFPEELPSGNGVWALSTGLSFLKTTDPAILFASVSWFYNFSERFSDISSTAGTKTPGRVKLGDSIQYGLGTAFALNERLSLSLSYSQRFVQKTRTKASGGNSTSVIGSDANVAVLNLGLTYAMSETLTMVVNLGVGLTPDAADVQLSIKFPLNL